LIARSDDSVEIATQMMSENASERRNIWTWNLDIGFQSPRAADRFIDLIRSVCRTNHDNAVGFRRAVEQLEEFVDAGIPIVSVGPRSRSPLADPIDFVYE
jgi:hypothetical protein